MTDLEQIKERVDIVELVQGYLRLQKAGMNFKGLCPFHNEKTPSFMVSPARQIWHCFGCSLGGDVFKFLMQIEGLEFKEALERLAKRVGIELRHFDKKLQSEKSKLFEISDLAAKFFEKQLWESENGKKALGYLKSRGLKDETISQWRLGYAPNTWNSLKAFLKNAGYSEDDIFKAGLTVKKNETQPLHSTSYILNYSYYDRFRGRIMFPIADLNSQTVGFTGRVFEEVTGETEMGKYVNTPQTPIYDKSRILYGLDKAKMEIRKGDRVLVVEGNMDAIMSHQAGVRNMVASSGTALTNQHLKILKRYTQNLNLCFDQDLAGETAAKRGIDLALADGFNVGITQLTTNNQQFTTIKDVADLVKINPQSWQEVSQKSQPIVQFYIDGAFQRHDSKTALGKKNIAGEVLPVVKLIDNKVEQAHWLDELANKLKIEQKILTQAMAAMKISDRPKIGSREEIKVSFESPSRLILEETLLALLFKFPQKAREIKEEEFEIFQDKLYNDIFGKLKLDQAQFSESLSTAIPQRAASGSAEPSTSTAIPGFAREPSMRTAIPQPLRTSGAEPSMNYEDKLRFELIKFKSDEFFGDLEEKDLESEINRLIKSLKKELILERIKDLEIKIKEAKNQGEILALLKEVQKFSTKLASL